MRILIATSSYYPGTNGQAAFTIRLAEGLAQAGQTVMVVTPSVRGRAYQERINQVEVRGLSAAHLTWLHDSVYMPVDFEREAHQVVQAFQPDLVHLQDHWTSPAVLRAAKRRNLPAVGTNHFLPENILPNVLPGWNNRLSDTTRLPDLLWWHMLLTFNQLEAAVAPSETAAQILRAQPIRVPVVAISNGVDTGRFRPLPRLDRAAFRARYGLPADRPLFLYVGRLDHEKRVDLALQALARLPAGAAHLAVAGCGGAAEEWRALARELGVAAAVTFTGRVPDADLVPLLNSADIFVMPSPEELQSIATLEAMAAGRPILAADVRALPELVGEGVNGQLFRSEDPEDLARAMRALLAAPETWPKLGQASLKRAAPHALSRTIASYAALYEIIVSQRAAEPAGALRRLKLWQRPTAARQPAPK